MGIYSEFLKINIYEILMKVTLWIHLKVEKSDKFYHSFATSYRKLAKKSAKKRNPFFCAAGRTRPGRGANGAEGGRVERDALRHGEHAAGRRWSAGAPPGRAWMEGGAATGEKLNWQLNRKLNIFQYNII